MVPGMGSRAGRRFWLVGSVAAVLTTATGAVAIVHYAAAGPAIGTGNGSLVATSKQQGQARPAATAAVRPAPPAVAPTARRAVPQARRLPRTSSSARSRRPVEAAQPAVAAAAPKFRTLPPGARLPSGAQCARWVRATPAPKEVRPSNRVPNHRGGQHVGAGFLAFDGQAAIRLSRRIDGDFTGTTQQILRWAACKWGIDQDMVFAQAAIESWWRQSTLGDWGSDASACPPGHGPGADGRPDLCPQSYGILQNRYPYEKLSWPGIARSTAMNADTAYAIWRACYDGYETWLNTVPHGSRYHAGDSWGCAGRWFAGRWRTSAADGYIRAVRKYMAERIWLTPNFRNAS